jgi:hypothetical protein
MVPLPAFTAAVDLATNSFILRKIPVHITIHSGRFDDIFYFSLRMVNGSEGRVDCLELLCRPRVHTVVGSLALGPKAASVATSASERSACRVASSLQNFLQGAERQLSTSSATV